MKEGQERRKKKGWEEKREDVNRDIRDEEEKKKTELNCSRAVKERERRGEGKTKTSVVLFIAAHYNNLYLYSEHLSKQGY